MSARVQPSVIYTALLSEPASYWDSLIKTSILDSARVVVKGRPSIKKQQEMEEEEENRIEKQQVHKKHNFLTVVNYEYPGSLMCC